MTRSPVSGAVLPLLIVALGAPQGVAAQADTTIAQEGLYDRPFIASLSATSIGGYVEGNTNYHVQDGVTDGFSMELRRFNIFLFSGVSPRVRFLSELEFEHGTEEIALETALVDVRIRPSLVFRAGIILPPLGYLNQNHDSPKWDFVERPLVTTDIIPSTLSEVGAGIYGRVGSRDLVLSYDAYLTNGLGDGVVENDLGRTSIPSGKSGDRLAEDNNGSPSWSGRIALNLRGRGELGVSHYGGPYNSFRVESEEVDERRSLSITTLDVGAGLGPIQARAELAYARIGVPASLAEVFGDTQWGAYLDLVAPIWRPRAPGYPDAVLSTALRFEHVDYNRGSFSSTGSDIRDDQTAVTAGASFRPTAGTVFRANYRYGWTRDFPGNPTSKGAGFQLGFSTYF